jgi:tetratricopeptide (TPR) repeat protein
MPGPSFFENNPGRRARTLDFLPCSRPRVVVSSVDPPNRRMKADVQFPASVTVAYARGYLALGLPAAAAQELGRTVASDRGAPEVAEVWIDLHLERRAWRRLAGVAESLRNTHPERERGWVFGAYAARELGRVEEAAAIAVAGAKRHPGNALIRFNLGCYLSLLGDLDGAERQLREAVRLAPAFAEDARSDPDYEALRLRHGDGFGAWLKGGV